MRVTVDHISGLRNMAQGDGAGSRRQHAARGAQGGKW